MAQTIKQRKANEKYAKHEAARRGKPKTATSQAQKVKPPVSSGWIVILAFVICGGLLFELLRVVPELWDGIASFFSRWA